MKIIDNRNNTEQFFHQIEICKCFEFDGTIYMRTYPAHNENTGDHFNAISLSDGEEMYFEGEDCVYPIDAHVVIEDPCSPDEKGSYRDNY